MITTATRIVIGTFAPLALFAPVASAAGGDVETKADVPGIYVSGEPFRVEVRYTAGAEGSELEAWRLGPAAFEVDGEPLAERAEGALTLTSGSALSWSGDLAPYLVERGVAGDFALTAGDATFEVHGYQAAGKGLDFMSMPVEELGEYQVLLHTNRGDMVVEFFPDVAPNHVRNFLDLAYTDFYDGLLFHRVSPTFMIQGGCPETLGDNPRIWGTGSGPRMLKAEFNDRKHVRGILSMARGPSPDSASSQFFIMTATNPGLDGKYSVFGRLVSGDDTLTRIGNAQGARNPDGTVRPSAPQRIEDAIVLKASR